jgi:hypothetical protein
MLRWNAQHWSLRRLSATAFQPSIVSGVSSRGRSSSDLAGRMGSAHDLGGDRFVEARGRLGVERVGDGL